MLSDKALVQIIILHHGEVFVAVLVARCFVVNETASAEYIMDIV